MMSNSSVVKQAIQKAELAVADLTSGSGLLVAEQADSFYRTPVTKSVLLRMLDVQGMNGPSKEISVINGVNGGRVLQSAAGGRALLEHQRVKVDIGSKVLLQSSLFRGAVPIHQEVFEDNISREALMAVVRSVVAEQTQLDIEEIVIKGDTASSDPFLKEFNGLIKSVTTNTVAAGGVNPDKDTFRDVEMALPSRYKEPGLMKYLTSVKGASWYRDSLGNRQTPMGDSAVSNGYNEANYAPFNGEPVIPIPVFPENLGSGNDETDIIYCNPKNIVLAYQREVRMTPKEDPADGTITIYVTVRFASKLKVEPAFVKATGVKIS